MPESKYEHLWAQIGKDKIWKDNEVKLIGIRPLLVEMHRNSHAFKIKVNDHHI